MVNYKTNDGAVVAGIFALVFVLFAISLAIRVVAIVFAVINGIALFGPDGNPTDVWHWVWFVICVLVTISGFFVRTSKN